MEGPATSGIKFFDNLVVGRGDVMVEVIKVRVDLLEVFLVFRTKELF